MTRGGWRSGPTGGAWLVKPMNLGQQSEYLEQQVWMSSAEPILPIVREMLRAAGLTQAALAARAGVSLATLRNIEAETANPALATLNKILSSLGLELGVRTYAVDWDALGHLGLPLMEDRVADGHADPTALPVLVRHAAIELSMHREQGRSERRKDALSAMLWALRSHFRHRREHGLVSSHEEARAPPAA